jgi:hypothetical protein
MGLSSVKRRLEKRRVTRPTSVGPMRCRDRRIKIPARIKSTASTARVRVNIAVFAE